MKRQSVRDDMIQSAVRLPTSLHDRLKKAGGERGMGEEIRRRLEASFDAEAEAPSDPKIGELLDQIKRIALSKPLDVSWHADRDAFEVFKAAISGVLSSYQPSDKASGPTGRLQTMYGPDAKAETVGRILAGVTGTFGKSK